MSKKLPAIQFYPGDWRKDVGVQSLAYHDRGVWFEMLMLMHESERRGVLILNGRAMPEESLARLLGLDKQTLTNAITALLDAGVASREPGTDALMSRRMVRDEKLRDTRKECGKLGGNPQLKKCTNQSLDNQNSTTPDNQTSTPSSSISSSSSETKTFARIQPTDVDIQRVYDAYPRKVGSMAAKTAVRRAVARLMRGIDAPAAMLAQEAIDYLADKVQRFARSPAGQQGKFTPHPATWFNDGRYLDDEMEWQKQQVEGRNAAKQGNATRGASVPAAVERQRVSHDAIRAAAARRYGVEPDAAHGRDAGLVPASDAARGNAGFVVGRVGGDRAPVWNGDVPGRVIEGDARVKIYT